MTRLSIPFSPFCFHLEDCSRLLTFSSYCFYLSPPFWCRVSTVVKPCSRQDVAYLYGESFYNFYDPSFCGSWISSNLGQLYSFLLVSWFSNSCALFCDILRGTATLTMLILSSSHLISSIRHYHPSIPVSSLDLVILQSKASVQEHCTLWRNPPMFTSMRSLFRAGHFLAV